MRSEFSPERPSGIAPAASDRGPIRIATIAACPFPCPRGTPLRIAKVAGALADRGHDVHVVTYHVSAGEDDPRVTVHRTPSVSTYRRLSAGPSYQKLLVMDPLLALRTRRLLRGSRFDIVHAHHVEGFVVALAATPHDVPIVFDAHTSLQSELPTYRLGVPAPLLKRLGRFIDRALPVRADHVIAVTPSLRRRLETDCGLPSEKVTVVGNGVAWEIFDVPRPPIHPDDRRIVFAGNLAPYQGIEHLLRAFARLRTTHPTVRLLLATEDPLGFAAYAPLADQLGVRERLTVRPTPFDELPTVLSESAVALNPRTACDGLPMKVLNYMSAALPIVSFVGSSTGLTHDRTAWLVPDADSDAFARAIGRLLDDPVLADRLGRAGREQVRAGGSWASVAEKVEDVFFRTLGRGGGGGPDATT